MIRVIVITVLTVLTMYGAGWCLGRLAIVLEGVAEKQTNALRRDWKLLGVRPLLAQRVRFAAGGRLLWWLASFVSFMSLLVLVASFVSALAVSWCPWKVVP